MKKKPTLRREHLTELGTDQLRRLVGGTVPSVRISDGSCVCGLESLDLQCQIDISETCTCTAG